MLWSCRGNGKAQDLFSHLEVTLIISNLKDKDIYLVKVLLPNLGYPCAITNSSKGSAKPSPWGRTAPGPSTSRGQPSGKWLGREGMELLVKHEPAISPFCKESKCIRRNVASRLGEVNPLLCAALERPHLESQSGLPSKGEAWTYQRESSKRWGRLKSWWESLDCSAYKKAQGETSQCIQIPKGKVQKGQS